MLILQDTVRNGKPCGTLYGFGRKEQVEGLRKVDRRILKRAVNLVFSTATRQLHSAELSVPSMHHGSSDFLPECRRGSAKIRTVWRLLQNPLSEFCLRFSTSRFRVPLLGTVFPIRSWAPLPRPLRHLLAKIIVKRNTESQYPKMYDGEQLFSLSRPEASYRRALQPAQSGALWSCFSEPRRVSLAPARSETVRDIRGSCPQVVAQPKQGEWRGFRTRAATDWWIRTT